MKSNDNNNENKGNKPHLDSDNNLVDETLMKGFARAGKIFFEVADKAMFEAIRGRYPDISLKEMLVCWQAYWAKYDHGFPVYEEILARLEKVRSDEIPETLRKEFHIDEGPNLLLFSSELDIKRAISQAHRQGYIRYKIEEYTTGGANIEKSDPSTLVWYPAIFIVLEEALYKELDEATGQICDSSLKQFFPSPSAEDEEIDRKEC
jgi:hypothetical protein